MIARGNGSARAPLLSYAPVNIVIEVRAGYRSFIYVIGTAIGRHSALKIRYWSPCAPGFHDVIFPDWVSRPTVYSDPTVTTRLEAINAVMDLAPPSDFPAFPRGKTVNRTPFGTVITLRA